MNESYGIFKQTGLVLLTVGASLITGLLSFSGFYAIRPDIFYSTLSFVLAVAFEGQIYFQNINDALDILTDKEASNIQLSNPRLRAALDSDTLKDENTAKIKSEFLQYAKDLYLLKNQIQTKQKKQDQQSYQKKLNGLKKEFLQHLLKTEDTFRKECAQKTYYEHISKNILTAVALSMSLATMFLLIEAFTVIPFLTAIPISLWPGLIIPLAILGGVAYAIQLFKTLNNIITDQQIQNRILTLYNQLTNEGLTTKTIKALLLTLMLTGLTLFLTFCTFGTWITIVKNTPKTFKWLFIFPKVVFYLFLPIMSALCALFFNLENSNKSLQIIESFFEQPIQINLLKPLLDRMEAHENIAQQLNPFRIILYFLFTPIRLLIFLAHLTSMSFLQNQVPNMSELIPSIIGFFNELLTDLHYFCPKMHHHTFEDFLDEQLVESEEDDHNDFPTRLLRLLVTPLYALSLFWDYGCSQWNTEAEDRRSIEIVIYKLLHRVFGDYLLDLWEPKALEERLDPRRQSRAHFFQELPCPQNTFMAATATHRTV